MLKMPVCKCVLIGMLILSAITIQAQVCVNGLYYDLVPSGGTDGQSVATFVKGTSEYTQKKIVIPEQIDYEGATYIVNAIDKNALSGDTIVKSLTIPATVESLPEQCFAKMKLDEFILEDGPEITMSASVFGSGNTQGTMTVLYIGRQFRGVLQKFATCKVETVKIGPMVKNVQTCLFEASYYVKRLEIADGVETIGEAAFWENTKIEYLRLPSTLVSIDKEAFSNINTNARIECYAVEPPTCAGVSTNKAPFYPIGNGIITGTLHVPDGAKAAYEASSSWAGFNIVQDLLPLNENSITVNIKGKGEVRLDTYVANNASQTLLIPSALESIYAECIPATGYEYRTISMTDSEGMTYYPQLVHNGGDVSGNLVNKNGLVINVEFAEPVTNNLLVNYADGSGMTVKINDGKQYSFSYKAPNNFFISEVYYDDEPLQNVELYKASADIVTPPVTKDATLRIVARDISTAAPMKMCDNIKCAITSTGVCIKGLNQGDIIVVSDMNGISFEQTAISNEHEIVLEPGHCYVIKAAHAIFKLRY